METHRASGGASTTLISVLHPPRYVLYAGFVALGGFMFGFDTGSIGPITIMPSFVSTMGNLSSVIQGLIVSMILIPAAMISVVSGSIADRISRIYAISLGGGIYAVGALLCACTGIHTSKAASLAMLLIGRGIEGLGEGIFLSTITVYSVEIAPMHMRGRLGAVIQIFITLGIMCGYFVCYGTLRIASSWSWRIPFVMQVCVGTTICLGTPWLPHSPRWLLHNGRREDAEESLRRLGIAADEQAELLAQDDDALATADAGKSGWRKSWEGIKAVWAPEYRGKTALAMYMLGTQQLSGIDGVLFYAPVLFQQAGLSSAKASFLASGVTGIVNVVLTIFAINFTDRFGRRTAILWGGLFMALGMTIIGILYSIPSVSATKSGQIAIIAMIYVYFVSFCTTWALLMRIHVSESQPVQTRAMVSSLAVSANWLVNWVVAFTTPMFLQKTSCGPYFLWAASIWVSLGVMGFWLQETKGRVLEKGNEPLKCQISFSKVPGLRRRKGMVEEEGGWHEGSSEGTEGNEVTMEKTQPHAVTKAASTGISPR